VWQLGRRLVLSCKFCQHGCDDLWRRAKLEQDFCLRNLTARSLVQTFLRQEVGIAIHCHFMIGARGAAPPPVDGDAVDPELAEAIAKAGDSAERRELAYRKFYMFLKPKGKGKAKAGDPMHKRLQLDRVDLTKAVRGAAFTPSGSPTRCVHGVQACLHKHCGFMRRLSSLRN
jgi:hypothetical protein